MGKVLLDHPVLIIIRLEQEWLPGHSIANRGGFLFSLVEKPGFCLKFPDEN